MRKKGLLFYCLIYVWFGISCDSPSKPLSRMEMVRFLEDPENGLYFEQDINGVELSVRYTPNELVFFETPKQSDTVGYKVASKYGNSDLPKSLCFILNISKNGKEAVREFGLNSYSVLIQRLAFEMEHYVYLVGSNNDTINLNVSFFDQTYGLTDRNKILLVFDSVSVKDNSKFRLHLDEFGMNTGPVDFYFDKQNILGIPSIE